MTITDTITGATIYYTTDGSTPTASSTLYTGAFQVSTDMTVQAIASAIGYLQSAVASATYNFSTQTPMPQFSPAAGTYTTTQSVTHFRQHIRSGHLLHNGWVDTHDQFDEIYRARSR